MWYFCIKKMLTEYLLNCTITENTHPKLSKSQHCSRMLSYFLLSVPTGENDEAWEGEAHTAAESCRYEGRKCDSGGQHQCMWNTTLQF